MNKKAFIIGSVVISLLLFAAMISLDSSDKKELEIIDTLGGDFELDSTLDKKVKLSDFKGKVVLLNFGYTFCPDICPARLTQLKNIKQSLGTLAKRTETLFVSFDPERDTITRLKSYLNYFDPSFIGLTGPTAKITEIISNYGGAFIKQKVKSDIKYAYGHSDYIYLIDQSGRVRAFYPLKTKSEEIISDIESLL